MLFMPVAVAAPATTPAAALSPSATPAAVSAASGVTVYDAAFFAGAQLSTAFDMMQRVPGFTLDTGEGVRGFGGSAGNVLIDGQRVTSKSDNLKDALNRIPVASIARIEIIRGGAPGIDMQGRSVLANIIMKTTARTDLQLVAVARILGDGRTPPAARVELERREGQTAFTFGFLYYAIQPDDAGKGQSTLRSTPGGPVLSRSTVNVVAVDKGVSLRSSLQTPLLGGMTHLNAAFDYDTFRENEDDGVTDFTRGGARRSDNANQQDRSRRGELGADYAVRLGWGINARLVALQSLGTEGFGSRSLTDGSRQIYRQVTRTGESIGRLELNWKPVAAFSLEGGGEIAYNFLQSSARYAQDGVAVDLPSAHISVDEVRVEAFLTSSWRITPKLQLEAGGRIESSTISQSGDSSNSASFTYPKPRVAVTWTPDAINQYRFTVERIVGQLNFSDFASSANLVSGQINAGNANLQPQSEWRVETAYERKIFGKGVLVATLRHAALQQVIDVVPVQGVDAPGNIGDGTRDTAMLSLTLPLAGIRMPGGQLKVDGTWIRSRVTDPTTREHRAISLDKPYAVQFALTNDVPRLKSSWEVDLLTGAHLPTWRIEEVRRVDYKPWLGLIWETKPRPGQTIHLEVMNVASRDRRRMRTDWTGLRGSSPIASAEQYSVRLPPIFYLRFRQAF